MAESNVQPASDAEAQALAVIESNQGDLEALRALYDPDLDFRKLALEAKYGALGFRLVDKAELVGVPFVIIAVVYRQGFPLDKAKTMFGDFVSCEAVVADHQILMTPQIQSQLQGPLTVFGNETIVFNDGGTGIRRTLTKLLDEWKLIDVGGQVSPDDVPWDREYGRWLGGADDALTGFRFDVQGEPFRYMARRGLRVSEYEYEGQPARTYYFG